MFAVPLTNAKIEVVLAGAITTNQLQCSTAYRDIATQEGNENAGQPTVNALLTNGATAVTLVPSPLQTVKHEVENITIHNADTASATVTVRYNDGTNTWVLMKVIMATLFTLVYERASGWTLYNASGVRQ